MTHLDRDYIDGFFQWLARAFFEGDPDWVEKVGIFPLTIFLGSQVRVDRKPSQTRDFILQRRQELTQQGVSSIRGRVLDVGEMLQAYYRVEVELRFLDITKDVIALNRASFLCQNSANGEIRIQSVDFLRIEVEQLKVPARLH